MFDRGDETRLKGASMKRAYLTLAIVTLGSCTHPESCHLPNSGAVAAQRHLGRRERDTYRDPADDLARSHVASHYCGQTLLPLTTITVLGTPFLTTEVTRDPKTQLQTSKATFGSAFSGIREMVLTSPDGQTFSGTIDGKQLQPFAKGVAPETLRFTDGSAPSDHISRRECKE